MNALDLVIVTILVVSLVAGWNSGFFPQLLGLACAALAVFLAIQALPLVRDRLVDLDPMIRALAVLTGILLAIAIGEAIGSGIGSRIKQRIGGGVLGSLDNIGGALISVAQGLLVVWLVGGVLAIAPMTTVNSALEESAILRAMNRAVPPPTAYVDDLRQWLNEAGVPELFGGLEPPPAEPVDTPTNREAERIASSAKKSTVEVRAEACNRISTGTGFVVGRSSYVVTNAHVVAGSKAITVGFDGGQALDSQVVLFDPELDVALLHVPGLDAPPLTFAPDEPGRGTIAAALGHPGGNGLTAIPAAVTNAFSAVGKDIYGTHTVTREVVELRAAIERGDSGGPLVLSDGRIGGVVYAESLRDPSVGYALSPVDVANRVMPSVGRTGTVATGTCVR